MIEDEPARTSPSELMYQMQGLLESLLFHNTSIVLEGALQLVQTVLESGRESTLWLLA